MTTSAFVLQMRGLTRHYEGTRKSNTHRCPEVAAAPALAALADVIAGAGFAELYARVVVCVCHVAVYTCVAVTEGSALTAIGVGLSTR